MTALVHVYFWIFALSPLVIRGFNVDTTSPVIHSGPTDSLFGFSVSVHQTQGTSWLLVGAPQAQTDQRDVVKGGAVYKCPASPDSSVQCEQIPFGANEEHDQKVGKSHQWLGASLKSTGRNGIIAACAPRYVSYVSDVERWEPVGTCYISKNDFTEFEEFSPCRDRDWGWDRVGFCQAGISADITHNKKHIVVGAIGSYYNQGQVYVKGVSTKSLYSTREGPPTDDNNYQGYSVATGEFSNDDNDEDFVVGVPRSNDLKGMVKVFNSQLLLLHELLGEQLGAYFGFAVAVQDVNNDRIDDIIVGAPFFTDKAGTAEKWEAGRVYVYLQNHNNDFSDPSMLTGVQSRARFGSSLGTLHDINQDGFKDIAIGAPYGGDDERGAVYIYHGSSKGLKKNPAQIIKASDISSNLRTFGSSLSGGLDMDKNHYTDLLVGAYESDQVILLRSKPVVNLDVNIRFSTDFIDLEDKKCADHGIPVACFTLTTCFSYTGRHVPSSIEVEFIISLDTLKFHPKRAYFRETGAQDEMITLTIHKKKRELCKGNFVFLKSDIKDKYSAIAVDVSYKLVENEDLVSVSELPPVVNKQLTSVIRKQAHILNDCGDSKICVPDLSLKAEMSSPIYIGSHDLVILEVTVTNNGDDAFESQVTIQLPPGFHYVRVQKRDSDYTVGCMDIDNGIGLVICDCGNPISAGHKVKFDLTLSTIQYNITYSTEEISLSANSSNAEESSTLGDNNIIVIIPVKINAGISFTGVSIPEQVTFKARSKSHSEISHEDDIGPEIIHLYEVRNLGPSSIDGADIQIFWPAYTPREEYLLYLLDVNLQGGLPCEVNGLNPEGIQVDEDKMSFRVNLTNTIANTRQLRQKRNSAEEIRKLDMDCRSARCVRIKCQLDFILDSGESALVEIRSRLWKDTLLQGGYDETEITSSGHVQVTSMPYHITPQAYHGADVEVTTIANTERPQPGILPIPIWVLVVSIVSGFLLLILVVIGLWKAGFFKRKRVEDEYTAQNCVNDHMSTYSGSPAFASLSTAESDIKSSRSNSNY